MGGKISLNIEPLSVNTAWQGRKYKSLKYNNWLQEGLWTLKTMEIQKVSGNVAIYIDFYTNKSRDIDNNIKTFLDLLCKADIIDDDRFVYELHIKKIDTVKRAKHRIEFSISKI